MKKILAFFLSVAIIFSAVPLAVNASGTQEEATYTVKQWEMLEIELLSGKEYSNPYLETEISAVFTHENGTVISLPGFIKDGNRIWAVRFTPTKTGLWSYSITCADTTNESLFSSGTIFVTPSSNKTMLTTHGFIKHSKDNRHFVYDDGTPFFWLGDTQWQSPNYLLNDECNYPECNCHNQAHHEINNRKAKGFTVFQTYFNTTYTHGLWESLGTKPSYTDFNERIDDIFGYAYASDMVLVIGFGLGSVTPTNISEKLLNRFVKYVVARYACYSLVWMTGQEITNTEDSMTEGKNCMEVYFSATNTACTFDGYNHPAGAHMYPMISLDERAKALDEESWHNVWILQKGHGATVGSKAFYKSYYYNTSGKIKPVIEAEANYEDINCGGFTGYNAGRMCAWKALLCGCAGFTYGGSGVWINAYSLTNRRCYGATSSYSYDLWYQGLDKPGSFEMTYLRRFFENLIDWQGLIPRYMDRSYGDFLNCDEKSLASADDKRTVVSYFYNADKTTGTVKNLDNTLLYDVYWYNTLTGKYIQIEKNKNCPYGTYTVPEKPTEGDWVLLITADNLKNEYIEETPFEDLGTGEISGTRVTPLSVLAPGGVYTTEKGEYIDLTSALFDNNTSTVWTPLNQRTSQTFFVDLATVQDLSHIVIKPNTGTVLPKLRVYASNDNENWTIVVDNNLRDNNIDANKNVSEKLSGCYRYLRIVLLSNTENLSLGQVADADYKYMYNEHIDNYYTVTEIADIAVYSLGIGTPAKEKTVVPESVIKPTVSPEISSTPAPTQAPYVSLTNGNCETSTIDGWGAFVGGSLSNVSGGANGSGHAIKYTPGSSRYGSVGFDLGPYIIPDKENGYNGYGAGEYKLSFWIKSCANDTGLFSVLVNSDFHFGADSVRALGEPYKNYNTGTAISTGKNITVTSDWQRVECTFTVSEEFITLLKQIYRDDSIWDYQSSSSTKFNTDVYTLWLRLDGSGSTRAFANGFFSYLVDDVSIECISPQKSRKAFSLTLNNTANTAHVVSNLNGEYLNDVKIENGTLNKSITVYNTSNTPLTVAVSLQALTKKTADLSETWAGPNSANATGRIIQPGESSTYTLSLSVENGIVSIPDCQEREISKFFLRLDVKGTGTGNTIVVADSDAPKCILGKFSLGVKETKYLYSLPNDNKNIGDCNGDGTVTQIDRIVLSRYLAKWDNSTYVDFSYTDINKDGTINSVDRIILSRFLAGWTDYKKYFE